MSQFQITSHRNGKMPSATSITRHPQRPWIQPAIGEEDASATGRQSIQ